MRRRRSIMLGVLLILLPTLISSQTYDAVPIGRPFLRPPPSPRQEQEPAPHLAPRGYQPPPRPSNFQPPRSYPTFRQPSLNLDNRASRPPQQLNWQMQQLQQQHPQRFQPPRTVPQIPSLPHNHLRAGAPGQVPQFPRVPQFQGGQIDPVNNIIIHLYLNAKDRMPSHTEIKTPVRGLFGIGTSHGGPGSHSDPIVITKDFDRDTLEFVDEGQSMRPGHSNIIEVKATVSTPNRQLENTVNHAVNQELNKAIPKIMDRMRGSTMTMDNGMRKELEEALVDELAKNLGESIDNTDITEEDLSKLIEEGFDEVTRGETTTTTTTPRPATVTVVMTRPPTTTSTTTTTTTMTTTRRPTTTTRWPPTTTTTEATTTEWSNLVTEQNNDDYFTEDSEDISQTSRDTKPPPATTTTRRIIVTSPSTTTTRVWTKPTPPPTTTTTATTSAPWTRQTNGHVHVMPGIRVTETSSTSTTTEAPTTTTFASRPPTDRISWTPPSTQAPISTQSPYRPPTSSVTFASSDNSEEQNNFVTAPLNHVTPGLPTRKPMIEVSPSIGPTHHGVVSLDSNEEDYESTVPQKPIDVTTERSTAVHNLPTKPSSAPTLHPSTFSPPLTSKPRPHSSSEEIQPNFVIPTGQCPTPNQPSSDHNKTDVLFLLDSSDSFNEERFQRAIRLISDTVSQFNNFGSDGTQVSLVQYNDEPYLEFSLRKHNCKKHLLDDIADTEYMTGGSQLTKALEKVSQFAFTKKRGDRPNAENVLIIVTDGQSTGRIQQPIRLAKENNVTVLVISTIEADKQFVNELSGNMPDNLFGLGGEDDLNQQLAWKLARRISESSSSSPSSSASEPSAPTISGSLTPVHPGNDDDYSSEAPEDNKLVTRRPVNSESENSGIVKLKCVGDGFKIRVMPPVGFRGVAVVKGYQDDAKCKATATANSELNLFISNEECGVTQVKSFDPKGLNSSLVLHLLHDKDLNTGEDRAYLLQCFIGSAPDVDTELSTNLDVVRSELAIAETISLSTLPPTCTYSLRRDGPDGPIVNRAVVGQTVWHRWECDGTNETTQAYGIQIHSCYASDDVERKFAFVDPHGCSSDLALLTDLTYADDSLTAWAASHVFNVHDADSLKFVCKLSLCTRDGDGCEGVTPPACGNTNKTGLLLTKRLAKGPNSVDEALTSALSTNVELSSRKSEGIEDVLNSAASSYLFWIVAVIAVAAIVTISIHSRNLAENSDTATTCSDPTTMSESQDFGGSIRSMNSSPSPPPNERLADFMRTFDRNRYV